MSESSFHGIIKEIGGVSADNFTGENLNSRAYLLSHYHTDHIQGLHKPGLQYALLQNKDIFIYMSEITAAIVKAQECSTSVVTTRVRPLKTGQTDIKLPAHGKWKEEFITVNVIPAGHCLGSVMFLLTRNNGVNVLYTGDFRIHENDVSKFRQLHKQLHQPIFIDKMYVDTTFLHKKYGAEFPSRTQCIHELVNIIKCWLNKGVDFNVSIKISGYYTTECIFVELSKQLNLKLWVDEKRYESYSCIPELNEIITTDPDSTRIYIRCDLCQNKTFLNRFTVGVNKNLLINISAMAWALDHSSMKAMERENNNKINVCFSTHCSRTELRAFVSYLQPKNIEGFPDNYVEDDDCRSRNAMDCDTSYLDTNSSGEPTRKKKRTRRSEMIQNKSIFTRYFSDEL